MTAGNEGANKRQALARAVAHYHAGCLRVIGSQNVALRDVRTAKKAALTCDLGALIDEEALLATGTAILRSPERPRGLPRNATPATHSELAAYQEKLLVWERVRELVQKAALEPYAKEIVYAAPLLAGFLPKKGGRVEPVLAPLFTQSVTAVTQHDGSIVLQAQDESIRFNTAVWQDSTTAQNVGQIQSLGIDAQGDLAGAWDPQRVEELLKGIQAVLPFARPGLPQGTLTPWPERPTPGSYREAQSSLALHEGAALFLSNRSSHYLLHDLEQILGEPSRFLDGLDDRPLAILLSDPSDENRPSPEWLTEDQVGFPFPSNPAQRQVADAIEENATVVVQGPPGTGKSLTIANLVAHLVAQGKSVLVTSHKQQALTVVRDKLDEMDLEFLYASLVGDTSQAKRELQSQIANVRAFAGMANTQRLQKQLAEIERRRAESGARYAAARDEFLKRAEPEQIEAAGIYPQIEPHPLLPVADPAVTEDALAEVAAGLRFLDARAREHGAMWSELTKNKLAKSNSIETVERLLRSFLDHQHARVRAATDEQIKALDVLWRPVFDADPAQLTKAREAIAAIETALVEPLVAVMASSEPVAERTAAEALTQSPELLADARAALEKLQQLFEEARALADARDALTADPVRRDEVVLHHMALASIVRRRGAKRWLDEHSPGAAGLSGEAVGRWCSFWESWSALRTQASGLGGGLRAEIPAGYDPDSVAQLIARVGRVVALTEALAAADRAAKTPRIMLPVEEAKAASTVEDVKETFNRWATAVSAAEADQEGNKLIGSEESLPVRGALAEVDSLLDEGRVGEALAPLERLEAVWRALPDLAERRNLLSGPAGKLTATVREIETAALVGEEAPVFLDEVELALRLHPVARRFAKIAANRSTRDLAIELQQLHRQVLEDARRLLGLRIQGRILERSFNPKFLASIEVFKRAVSTSAKRHERFEELKNSPNFDIATLTDVFPCWIMRPEDVCRIFPLQAGIFDVVIFDEASQCNPDQALPLFARAKKVGVFGDQKQLTNEDLRRTLSTAANKALLRQAELEPLDPTGLFDQTRNSLLDLVSQRQQAAVLLNEHFRCRPEIVAFSNERFYGNTLRIIRDRADDRGLGPALLIRQVLNPLSGTSSKINYAEARAVVDELIERLTDSRYAEMTFGVLSLFREQIEHIQTLVEREVDRDLLERHRVICSTVDGFQGDERDVILYSWRFARGASPSIFAFTNGEGGSQRVNVALTRARHQAIHFVSAAIDQFPFGAANITPYLKHGLHPERMLAEIERRAHRTPGGKARWRVAKALLDAGFEIEEDFVACGASIDLLVTSDAGARVAVFVDAEVDPHPAVAALHRVDVHSLLERAGWRVVRIPATEALPNPQKIVGLVSSAVEGVDAAGSGEVVDAPYATVSVDRQKMEEWIQGLEDLGETIEPEDRADYHWEVGSVEARLHAGETVFMSDFERELYDWIAATDGLVCVPQWPSRGKFIDLVVTDSDGRRLAVEADGEQHHEMAGGTLIPEDIERQGLLEEAGWIFHRIRHGDFRTSPDQEIERLLAHLREQPANADLAARIRGDELPEPALDLSAAPTLRQVVGARPEAEPAEGIELLAEPIAEAAPSSPTRSGELIAPAAGVAPSVLPEEAEVGEAEQGESASRPASLEAQVEDDRLAEETEADDEPTRERFDPSMSPRQIESRLDEVFTKPEDAYESAPRGDELPGEAVGAVASPDASIVRSEAISDLGDLPLRMMVTYVGALVAFYGSIDDDELVESFSSYYKVEVPKNLRSLLIKFAWSAKGHKFVAFDGTTWTSGDAEPHEIDNFGDWTFNAVIGRAKELLPGRPEKQVYERLLGEIYSTPSGRVPRIVTTVAGKAIWQAQHS